MRLWIVTGQLHWIISRLCGMRDRFHWAANKWNRRKQIVSLHSDTNSLVEFENLLPWKFDRFLWAAAQPIVKSVASINLEYLCEMHRVNHLNRKWKSSAHWKFTCNYCSRFKIDRRQSCRFNERTSHSFKKRLLFATLTRIKFRDQKCQCTRPLPVDRPISPRSHN